MRKRKRKRRRRRRRRNIHEITRNNKQKQTYPGPYKAVWVLQLVEKKDNTAEGSPSPTIESVRQ